jgi:diguanylate cyclase (GGDEF)-like protein
MTSPVDAYSLAAVAFPVRVAAAMASLWCGGLLGLVVSQRGRIGDTQAQRSWLLAAGAVMGVCVWAGHLCAAMALAGAAQVPLAGATLALLLAGVAAVATLASAAQPGPARRLGAGAVATSLLLAEAGTWVITFELRPSPVVLAVGVAALAAAQIVTFMLLWRWQSHKHAASWQRSACVALLLAIAHGLPLFVVGLTTVPPPPVGLSSELLFALLGSAMALLALQAGRMGRRLMGRHQKLGAQLQQATANLQRTPYSDPLTGLLSRLGLEAALRKSASLAESQGERIALFAVGLDGFKSINDSFGHALGDSVLREVSRRLATHAAAHRVARLGGDEFVLMLQGRLDLPALAHAAGSLLEALDGPLECDAHELRLTASIGVAWFPDDGGASTLIARARAAMQAAKAAGGSTFMRFEPRMQDDAHERHELLRDLRQAIDNKQFELFYQPKIDARSGQVTAAEALLRWHHPVRGMLGPDLFIPLAERHGLIGALGNWVIEDACRQARVWRERGLKMRVAINLSVFQMRQNDLVERIQAALARHGVNPSRLTCEITESVAMEDTQVTQRTFERLGRAGIHLSIDDFGTGYSSLSYLRRLPATELKIDRSFVMDLDSSADARAIVDAVLKLAHAIGLKVVAEGVETVRQRDILLELGCDEFQGYLFARPMSARALLLWAVDDKPARNAFRPSLFADTDLPGLDGAPASVQAMPLHAGRRSAAGA